jgi:hypothetical protein
VKPPKCQYCEKDSVIITHGTNANDIPLCQDHLRELVEHDMEDEAGEPWGV